MEVGAVAAMRYVKDGIKAAKLVMKYTDHTLIVGEQASAFAISMGLPGPSNLSSTQSIKKWIKWKQNSCQPNFQKNVFPTSSCGPYHPQHDASTVAVNTCGPSGGYLSTMVKSYFHPINHKNHDTISMAVIDNFGRIAIGTSTNGASFKIPDRVGDGPIVGSSAYADDEVGACGATGDGDIMMRFLPCYQVVESMRQGMEPKHAAADAISRIASKFPNFIGAVFTLNMKGVHAGACHGWTFQYSVRAKGMEDVQLFLMKRGGEEIYVGPLGHNSCELIKYFEAIDGVSKIKDACFWSYCGGGNCIKTSAFKHRCKCKKGFDNILNIISFPYVKDCAIGADCSSLGFALSNGSIPPNPTNLFNNGGQVSSQRNLLWFFLCTTSLAVIQATWMKL